MSPARSRIKAASWWNTALKSFENIIMESLRRAQVAERAEKGHDCGHEFTIQVTMRGHSSGAGDDPTHSDAQYADTLVPVVVRAHSLRAGLLLAAAKPLSAWFPDEELTVEEAHVAHGKTGQAVTTPDGVIHPESGLIDVRWRNDAG